MTTNAAGTQVYQTYINAPQEKVWEAITTPEIVAVYFRGAQVQGSYQPGSRIRMASPDGTTEWGNNTVLEADPPRRLVHTWRSLYDPDMAAEPESRVTWEIEALPDGYCLAHPHPRQARRLACDRRQRDRLGLLPQQPEVAAGNRQPAAPAAPGQLTNEGSRG